MTKWEYLTVRIYRSPKKGDVVINGRAADTDTLRGAHLPEMWGPNSFANRLKALGGEGWELIKIQYPDGRTDNNFFIFKRSL